MLCCSVAIPVAMWFRLLTVNSLAQGNFIFVQLSISFPDLSRDGAVFVCCCFWWMLIFLGRSSTCISNILLWLLNIFVIAFLFYRFQSVSSMLSRPWQPSETYPTRRIWTSSTSDASCRQPLYSLLLVQDNYKCYIVNIHLMFVCGCYGQIIDN